MYFRLYKSLKLPIGDTPVTLKLDFLSDINTINIEPSLQILLLVHLIIFIYNAAIVALEGSNLKETSVIASVRAYGGMPTNK